MAAAIQYIELAKALPPRLLTVFRKWPTPALLAAARQPNTTPSNTVIAGPSAETGADQSQQQRQDRHINPFQPFKHPATGRWHPPLYSLRRQAELVKLAEAHGVEQFLPYTRKLTSEKVKRRQEHGLRVKGTGLGQKVKGHEWERTLKGRLERRKQAMMEMPQLIQEWKERGHGRYLKKSPR